MHDKIINEGSEHDGNRLITVPDGDDVTCLICSRIIAKDDSVRCDICDCEFCFEHIETKKGSDYIICQNCIRSLWSSYKDNEALIRSMRLIVSGTRRYSYSGEYLASYVRGITLALGVQLGVDFTVSGQAGGQSATGSRPEAV